MEEDRKYMLMALEEARAAFQCDEVPIGAVICHNGTPNRPPKIVARAHNLTETLNDPTAHAEMQAITAACNTIGGKYLADCTLYVTVEPCPMCAGAIAWAQLGRLVYGADDPKRGFTTISTTPNGFLHPKTKVEKGVCAQEAATLLKDFFAKKR